MLIPAYSIKLVIVDHMRQNNQLVYIVARSDLSRNAKAKPCGGWFTALALANRSKHCSDPSDRIGNVSERLQAIFDYFLDSS